MKKTIIFGAGQCGKMAYGLLKRKNFDVIAFADNNPKLAGSSFCGLPVLSAADAAKEASRIFIAAMGAGRCEEIKNQLIGLGFSADNILSVTDGKENYDIRQSTMYLLAKEIQEAGIEGDLAELGVFQGEFASAINDALPDRTIYLFDTFEGFADEDIRVEEANGFSFAKEGDYSDTSAEAVLAALPHPEKAVVCKGYFPETAHMAGDSRFALVSIDADLYQPIKEGLKFFWPRMERGGYIIIHDYNNMQYKGAGQAVKEFCRENNLFAVPLADLHGSVILLKG